MHKVGQGGRALLVVGTDTGVGKTVVSVLLLAALRRRGLQVLAQKPVETGCQPDPEDALALAAVCSGTPDLDQICPYRFRLPAAPQSAAAAEGQVIDPQLIQHNLQRQRQQADFVLVESAGGLGTPFGPDLLVLDLARRLELPVVLVARHVLGTVGQTLVALRLMHHEGVRCVGVVLSQTTQTPPGPEGPTHLPLLAAHAPVPSLGLLPHLGEPLPRLPDEVRSWADRHVAALEEAMGVEQLLTALTAFPVR
jgi:dethiobiotin synthetase